jgi:uncharacterized protein with HEPN domain
MSDRNTSILLNDIIEAIGNIFEFTRDLSFGQYCNDIKTKHAVERNFTILGEASARIPDSLKLKYKEINWRLIKDFRNIIVHDYFGIDDIIVWDIIQLNLSDLLQEYHLF